MPSGVSLIDVVKGLLGDADKETTSPSMAEITIISTGGAKSSSESPSGSASG